MSILFKSCVIIGSVFVISKIFKKINPKLHSSYKMKCFISGLKMYSKVQILKTKLRLLTIPYYNKIKKIIWKKDIINGPDSFLHFYKNNELVDQYKISYKDVIENQLLPIEKDDSNELEYKFEPNNLIEYVRNLESSNYDYLVIENCTKKKTDIIVRSKENAFDLVNIEYSKTEFLILQLNIEDKNINLELTNDLFNLNVNGNIIDKNMVFLYNKYINNLFKFTMEYTIFIVDRDLNQVQLSNEDSIKLDQGKYIANVKEKNIVQEENYEVIN